MGKFGYMCPSSSKSTDCAVLLVSELTQLTCDQVQLWLRRYNDSSSNHKVACLTLLLPLDKKLEYQIAVNCERASRVGLNLSRWAAQHVTWPTLQPLCASSAQTTQFIRHVFFKDLKGSEEEEVKGFLQNPNGGIRLLPKTRAYCHNSHRQVHEHTSGSSLPLSFHWKSLNG